MFEPQTLAEGVHVTRAVLPAGVGEVAVHVVKETPSSFRVDVGREVGQANMAADVSRSAVAEPPAEGCSNLLPVIESPLAEFDGEEYQHEEPPSPDVLQLPWEEYAQLLPGLEDVPPVLPEIDIMDVEEMLSGTARDKEEESAQPLSEQNILAEPVGKELIFSL